MMYHVANILYSKLPFDGIVLSDGISPTTLMAQVMHLVVHTYLSPDNNFQMK